MCEKKSACNVNSSNLSANCWAPYSLSVAVKLAMHVFDCLSLQFCEHAFSCTSQSSENNIQGMAFCCCMEARVAEELPESHFHGMA